MRDSRMIDLLGNIIESDQDSYEDKKRQLYLRQKALLEQFLEKGAISRQQYEKSLHDLTEKMGYDDLNDDQGKSME